MADSAVRRRRVRFFEVVFTILLLVVLLDAAFLWQDLTVTPAVSMRYVEVPSTDGVTLSGLLIRPTVQEGLVPGVVVVHGITAYKESMNRISVELARRGFVVLAIDLRDHGMSNGQCAFGLPAAEPQDVINAIQFLRDVDGVDRNQMAVVGHSFGAMVALTAVSLGVTQVNATVVWAPPTNLTSLRRDNFETVLFVVDQRVVPANILEPEELRIRSPITYVAGARPGSVLFLHGDADRLIPVNQSLEGVGATPGAEYRVYLGVDHSMDRLDIVEDTIHFIELKTKGRVSAEIDPVYPAFTRDGSLLALLLALLAVPAGWLGYERWCTRDPLPVKLYNYPGDKRPTRAALFVAADVGTYLAAVWAASLLYTPGGAGILFQGALPASGLFTVLLVGGLLLAAATFGLSGAERRVRGRDDRRFEEAQPLARSLACAGHALLILPVAVFLQYLQFQGANYPRSGGFGLALFVFLMLAVGFEAFLRTRIQRRLRSALEGLFGTAGARATLVSIGLGTLLHFVMLAWALALLFRGYVTDPVQTAAALTIAVGILSSILYDRTRNILPGALYTGVFLTWVFNASFHF